VKENETSEKRGGNGVVDGVRQEVARIRDGEKWVGVGERVPWWSGKKSGR